MNNGFGSGQLRAAVVLALCAAVALPMAASTATSTTIKVTLGKPKEMGLTISPAKVGAGTVTFQVTNSGKLPHVFQVCSSPLGGKASRCSGPKTAKLGPGKTAKLVAKLGIGKHEFLDPANATGFKGTLVVIAAAPSSGGGTTTNPTTTPSTGAGPPVAARAAAAPPVAARRPEPGVPRAISSATRLRAPRSSRTAGAVPATRSRRRGRTGGIDLDAFAPEQQTVIDNVSNGNTGGMPDFSLQLTPAQIRNVASYVYCVTHGKTPANC